MLLSIGIIVLMAFAAVALCKLALWLDSEEQETRFRLKVIRESYEQQKAAVLSSKMSSKTKPLS